MVLMVPYDSHRIQVTHVTMEPSRMMGWPALPRPAVPYHADSPDDHSGIVGGDGGASGLGVVRLCSVAASAWWSAVTVV